MAQSALNGTAQPVDTEKENINPATDGRWLTYKVLGREINTSFNYVIHVK